MYTGLEHCLGQLWQRWQNAGARPEAEPLVRREGWLLTLCFRAKLTAWLIFLLFAGLLAGVLVMQAVAPQRQRVFVLEVIGFVVFSAMALYYVVFTHWYRVELDEQGLALTRFLLPTRRLGWTDVVGFEYTPGDELLKLRSQDGRRVGLYLSLNGLSAVRRCLAAFTPLSATLSSWNAADPALMQHVRSWRCHQMDLEDSPFDPLGNWDAKSQGG